MHKGIILSLNEIYTELSGLLSVPFSVSGELGKLSGKSRD